MTIAKFDGVTVANVSKVKGVLRNTVNKINGVTNPRGVTIGNNSASSYTTTGTTITFSHTCVAGSNVLIVSCLIRGTTVQPTISMTYNSVAMTQITSANQTLGSLRRLVTFRITSADVSFDTSAHDVVVTASETITAGQAGGQDFGGVDIAGTPFGTTVTASGSSTAVTANVATAAADVAYAAYGADNNTNGAPGNGQTETYDVAGLLQGSAAGYLAAPANPQAMAWTITSSAWVEQGFSIKPIP